MTMASVSAPVEQPKMKPSFAKVRYTGETIHMRDLAHDRQVAASAYKPHTPGQSPATVKPAVPIPAVPIIPAISAPQANSQSQAVKRPSAVQSDAPKVRILQDAAKDAKEDAGNPATRTSEWTNTECQQVILPPRSKENESEKPRPAITLARSSAMEDSSTQLSSSDGSTKPASLDGKSVASVTTFALDEKESIRPDDSASLRAVEEEDVTSPPESVAADSRVGSDSGVARAFRDQLHEIAVMGPVPQRGAPPGRFPSTHLNGPPTLYDPNQSMNGIGRSISQPVMNGMPPVATSHNMATIPDEKLIEALESPRDRLFVLKLEQDFIDFIKDSR